MCRDKEYFFKMFLFVISILCVHVHAEGGVPSPRYCTLPKEPKFGRSNYYFPSCKPNFDEMNMAMFMGMVRSGTIVKMYCQSGYKLIGDTSIGCVNGQWTNEVPICSAISSRTSEQFPMFTSNFIQVSKSSCSLPPTPEYGVRSIKYPPNQPTLENNTESVPSGTTVTIDCESGYKRIGDADIVCNDGQWTNEVPKCSGQIQPQESCKLGTFPEHGVLSIIENPPNRRALKNTTKSVPSGTTLTVDCQSGYKHMGDAVIVCINGIWTNRIGKCLKMCPPIHSTVFMTVTCKNSDNTENEDCTEAIDGTVAQIRCADYYEDLAARMRPLHICNNGKWSNNEPYCVPMCGQRVMNENIKMIVGGAPSDQGEYPWQAAIYTSRKKELICSGSLISQRIVLTAAHCVTDATGHKQPKEDYILGVGNYYRNFNDSRDLDKAQFSTMEEIFLFDHYRGDIHFQSNDIAVLVTRETFYISKTVQPVCISRIREDYIRAEFGYVSGWGFTVAYGNPSSVLKKLKVPLVTYEKCKHELSDDLKDYLTNDKLCAGHLNSNVSICKGDSGGGLVVKNENNNRFHIVGIVSVSPNADTSEGGCDSRQYGLFTNISFYASDFIAKIEGRFIPFEPGMGKPMSGELDFKDVLGLNIDRQTERGPIDNSSSGCVLPDSPFDKLRVVKTTNFTSGMSVDADSIIVRLECNDDEIVDGNDFIVCNKGVWTSSLGICSFTQTKRQPIDTSRTGCVLPEPPPLGKLTVVETTHFTSGMSVDADSIIVRLVCDKDSIVNGNDLIVCNNKGVWTSSLGTCSLICPARFSTPIVEITCVYENSTKKDCINAVDGTLAKHKCAKFYEDLSLTRHPVHICHNGRWNRPTPNCKPVCGRFDNSSNFPWQVSIYHQNGLIPSFEDLFCSGTLISQNLILTAAQCVTEGSTDKLKPVGQYIVAVGKDYQGFSDNKDVDYAQFSAVRHVFIPSSYRGDIQNYLGDIAILVTEKVFTLSSRVQPVCLDFGQNYDLSISDGYISTRDDLTETYQVTQISSGSFTKCRQSLPEDFETYLTHDKICAASSVSNGMSGGGLVYKFDGRYFIKGIISAAFTSFSDDQSEVYSFFTKVDSYILDFISEKTIKYSS